MLGMSWKRLWSRQGLGVGFAEGDGVNAEMILGKTVRKKEGRGFQGKTEGFPQVLQHLKARACFKGMHIEASEHADMTTGHIGPLVPSCSPLGVWLQVQTVPGTAGLEPDRDPGWQGQD